MDATRKNCVFKNTKKTKKRFRKKRNEDTRQRQSSKIKTNQHVCRSNEITNEKFNSNVPIKNVTKKRLTIRHGLFAKGIRTETFMRSNLSEEFIARSEENLHKIIDLANGRPISSSNIDQKNIIIKESNTQIQFQCITPILELQKSPVIQNKVTADFVSPFIEKDSQKVIESSEKTMSENLPRLLGQYFKNNTFESMIANIKSDLNQLCIKPDENNKGRNGGNNNRFLKENNVNTEVILNPLKFLENVQKNNKSKGNMKKRNSLTNSNCMNESKIIPLKKNILSEANNLGEMKKKKFFKYNCNYNESEDSDENQSCYSMRTPDIIYYPRKLN